MYSLLKNLFFLYDPERVHDFVLEQFSKNPTWLRKLMPAYKSDPELRTRSSNLDWKNPMGLAAGFDKNGVAVDFLDYLGFGAIEVGTVTLKAQPGNPRPRIWRYPKQKALRNALGFPCLGADVVYHNLKNYDGKASLGINIGKNKDTKLEDAPAEYAELFRRFQDIADYMVINISSPNTQGLRELQNRKYLEELLGEVNTIRKDSSPPLFVKISPDESVNDLEEILDVCLSLGMSGIIATNTTKDHPYDKGGYSGEPIFQKSKSVWKFLLEQTESNEKFDIIGVGGISSKKDVKEFQSLKGKFFQIYTSFIYRGPQIFDILG